MRARTDGSDPHAITDSWEREHVSDGRTGHGVALQNRNRPAKPTVKGRADDRTARTADGTRPLIFPLVAEPAPRRRWAGKALAGVLLGALLAGVAVVALDQLNQPPAPGEQANEGAEMPRGRAGNGGGRLSVFELEVGTCLRELAEVTAVQYVDVVACDDEHTAEVVASLWMPGERWPGTAAVEDFASDRCIPVIRGLGVAADADLRWTYFGPSETTWNARSDRTISCLVVTRATPLTESVINEPSAGSSRPARTRTETGERL